jgi:outer membrane receptor for ferrienterochelin and colicin
MLMPKKAKLALALSLALAASSPVFAQQTSAAVGGRVVESSGQPIAGAEVTILHTPSGTVSRAVTDANGRYSARGLRVGGPYTITVQKDDQIDVEEDVYLLLGEVVSVDAELGAADTLETVEVVGSGGGSYDVFTPEKMGAGSNVTREQIEALPSIARDIQDYVRMDPRVAQTDKERGEISAGGQNTRYNVIRIDGVNTNDPFGLEANNYPTQRQPVSLDAIEEISIDLSNYDTTVTGGTGAVVNAVTKSGTNEFSGSVYYIYRDKDWVRDRDDRGFPFNGFKDQKTYGATFGGPIIKDTLFFFLNYEKYEQSRPGVSIGDSPLGDGGITMEDISEAQRIARDVYGFDAGNLDTGNLITDVEEYAVKLDWNINEDHRAYFRYSKLEQIDANTVNFNNNNVSLNSQWYNHNKTFESYVGQLFSDWSDIFSTEMKVSYREYDAIRNPFSRLPSVQIRFGGDSLYLGTDQFSHRNELETDQLSGFFAGYTYVGDHELKFGADYETNSIFNLFGRDLYGVYTFDSLEDFEAGTSSFYSSRGPQPGQSIESIAADVDMANLGLFAQDTWAITPNLSLMYGFRVDIPKIDDKPTYNARIEELYGYNNQSTIDGNELIQPRFGFNYTFDTERPTQLRGGFGLFQGAAATVWLSNPYANTGFNFVQYQASSGIDEFSADPDNQPHPDSAPPRMAVDLVDPELQQPSVWKMNLAFDHELPWWGMIFTAEALWTQVNEGIYYERLDLGAPTGAGDDGRMMFWNGAGYLSENFGRDNNGRYDPGFRASAARDRANRPGDIGDVTIARSTNKGEGEQFTVSLSKPMTDSWSWMLAYTYTDATEVNPLTSSQATSNWNNNMIFQANENVAARSNYSIKDRVLGTTSYRYAFFDNYHTTFSLVYEGRSGKPYSWTFFNDVNGDSRVNDLFYVPTGPGDVLFHDATAQGGLSSAEQETAFFDWLESQEDLQRYAGQVAPRNTSSSSWVNNFDVRISQELPGFFGDNKAEVWLDILNIGNLINKDWGHIDEIGFPSSRRVAYYHGVDPETGKYVYYFNDNVDRENRRDNRGESRWALQVGFRYKF